MNTDFHRTSAKIYQFPVGGRAGQTQREAAAQPAPRSCAIGSGWYHEAAIQEEAERNRTPRR
ncbi:DUF2735 domain-containing protein [Methylobacterium dankookense]|uniref:DUF2735 domain-containing protein n=1 Tax=Methylobacterium dankookense TaxID=560405 RepID=A0A564FWN2_9HYPH|nr:DUF2735 domain-containing protein [Methylobacterium dankookense]GJD57913.1 hypothetical protein IFDJLNFL_3826 [Methylobacterium dankookense]VUF12274.1 hypothetical protein MTDSW087_01963 [Methylobacterium dankookense]